MLGVNGFHPLPHKSLHGKKKCKGRVGEEEGKMANLLLYGSLNWEHQGLQWSSNFGSEEKRNLNGPTYVVKIMINKIVIYSLIIMIITVVINACLIIF